MGIEAKHAYRFVYLRSEEWKDVRFEALAREKAKCQICGFEDFSNDAHHVFYPSPIWDTKADDLVILCRPCHELAQSIFIQQANRERGKQYFNTLVNIIKCWVAAKKTWINDAATMTPRIAKVRVHTECQACSENSLEQRRFYFFKELPNNVLDSRDFSMSLCPRCISDALHLKIHDPSLEGDSNRLHGFAYRAIRVWKESRNPEKK